MQFLREHLVKLLCICISCDPSNMSNWATTGRLKEHVKSTTLNQVFSVKMVWKNTEKPSKQNSAHLKSRRSRRNVHKFMRLWAVCWGQNKKPWRIESFNRPLEEKPGGMGNLRKIQSTSWTLNCHFCRWILNGLNLTSWCAKSWVFIISPPKCYHTWRIIPLC